MNREAMGVAEGSREERESWHEFLRYLKDRGLERIRLLVSDKNLGLLEALYEYYPDACWQRCAVHFPECAACHASGQNPGSEPDAQGHPCSGRP